MEHPKAALFVTCLIDNFRPEAGFAAARLLERAGCNVVVPAQSCCGQPSYNGGDAKNAAALARNVIVAFEAYDYVVVPSGSCAGMIKFHYAEIFRDAPDWAARAKALSEKTYELFSFLEEVCSYSAADVSCPRKTAYHDSCSSLRETCSAVHARNLLRGVEDLDLRDIPDTEVCCGFGGLFSVKFPEISARMADDKIANIKATGAELLIGPDLGCLLHLQGRLSRKGETIAVRHAAEILCGMDETSPLGGAKK